MKQTDNIKNEIVEGLKNLTGKVAEYKKAQENCHHEWSELNFTINHSDYTAGYIHVVFFRQCVNCAANLIAESIFDPLKPEDKIIIEKLSKIERQSHDCKIHNPLEFGIFEKMEFQVDYKKISIYSVAEENNFDLNSDE